MRENDVTVHKIFVTLNISFILVHTFTYVHCKWMWCIFNFNTSNNIIFDIVNIRQHICNVFSVVLYSIGQIGYCSLENPLFFFKFSESEMVEKLLQRKRLLLYKFLVEARVTACFFSPYDWVKTNQCYAAGWDGSSIVVCSLASCSWITCCKAKLMSVAKCSALFETLIILAKLKNVTVWH